MRLQSVGRVAAALVLGALVAGPSAWAGTPIQVGPSGKTFASRAVLCLVDPSTGLVEAAVDAGLYQPSGRMRAVVSLNGQRAARVDAAHPVARLWLPAGSDDVAVRLNRGAVDHFAFDVSTMQCQMPDTSGNSFSADGVLEVAASGKSSATVTPGCALNPATGEVQPFVNLFDNGSFLLNVSVNGVPLTQLGPQRPSTPVFLQAGLNVLSAAHGSLSIDHYVRDAGDGSCTPNP
jgi:hypothetical protein